MQQNGFFKMKNGSIIFLTSEVNENAGSFTGRNLNLSKPVEETFYTKHVATRSPQKAEVLSKLSKMVISTKDQREHQLYTQIKASMLEAAHSLEKKPVNTQNAKPKVIPPDKKTFNTKNNGKSKHTPHKSRSQAYTPAYA